MTERRPAPESGPGGGAAVERRPAALREFVREHREEIIARCRARVTERMIPRPTPQELEHGIPLFLRELEQTLECELGQTSAGATAAVQPAEGLLRSGFSLAQVVHDYSDVCQALTEVAIERGASITTGEFRTLNSCLDHAIAEAVAAYARQHERDVVVERVDHTNEQLRSVAHQLRGVLATAMLAFEVLREGTVGIQGSTGDLLGRSLVELRDQVDRSLTEVRVAAGRAHQETIAVADFLEDVEVSTVAGARARKLRMTVSPVDRDVVVQSDRQILASILCSLLQHAFEHTRPHSHVWLRARATPDRVLFEIEDQCGGMPEERYERLLASDGEQGSDRSGPAFALCVRGTRLLRGSLRAGNRNHGCVFTVDLPRMQT